MRWLRMRYALFLKYNNRDPLTPLAALQNFVYTASHNVFERIMRVRYY